MEVKKGSKIAVNYEGRFTDGEVFDSSEKHGGEPLNFTAGEGMVVRGFDEAVIGMKVDEEKEVTIPPEEGYGKSDSRAIQKVPKNMMPEGIKEGMQIGVPLEGGQMMPAKITKIENEEVTVDMNHPLADKTLIFKIKIKSIE